MFWCHVMVELLLSFIELYIWAYTPLSIDFSHSFSISCLSDFIQWPCWGRDAKSGTHACAIFFSPCFVSVFPSGMIEVYDSILFDPQNNPRQCQPGFCLWSTCWEIKVYDFMQHQLLLCLVNLNWISRAVLKLTLATMIGEDEFNLHRYWLENGVI